MPPASAAEYFQQVASPSFSAFGMDIDQPGVLDRVVREVAVDNEIILVSGDGSSYASPMALNTVLQFRDLGHENVLFLSDSTKSCERLRSGVPTLKCVWSSRIPTTRPPHDGLCVKRFWDMRFYFYDLRKDLLYRLAVDHGVNVLQTDTDVTWLASPYPLLKSHFANHSLVVQRDAPLVNAGVIYVQNARRGTGAAWLLQELARRVNLFLWHPEAVKQHVPWAKAPYYANSDEQTLMNDVLISSIADDVTYASSTAQWEVKLGSSKGVNYAETTEKKHYDALARKAHALHAPIARTREANEMIDRTLCERPQPRRDYGGWYPLHEVGGSARLASSYASAPNWLFAHYPADASAWLASGHSANEPPLCQPGSLQEEQQQQQQGSGAPSSRSKPPYAMLHMAGVRSGAWHRRALLRAHGWWHPEADRLMGAEAGWKRQGVLRVAWPNHGALPTLTPAKYDTLVANLMLLGVLSGRAAVVPDIACPAPDTAEAAEWKAAKDWPPRLARIHQGGIGALLPAERCSWVSPQHDPCMKMQYVTAAEHAAAGGGGAPSDGASPKTDDEAFLCATRAVRGDASPRRVAGGSHALLPDSALPEAVAAGQASPLLAPLLRTLECHAGQEEVVLTAALLQPLLGTDVSALAAQPLMQDPSRAIRDAKPTAQDVNDVSCVAHLFHGVHAR